MSTLVERIEELMAATGWDIGEIARIAGVSSSAVSQWLGRGGKPIHSIGKMEAAVNLEQRSNFAALWLAKGKGPKLKRATGPLPQVQAAESSLPPYFRPWPFTVTRARFDQLDEAARAKVDSYLGFVVTEWESSTNAHPRSTGTAAS